MRWIIHIAILIICILLQVSFISALPAYINAIFLPLIMVIFFTVVISYERALVLALIGGLLLDIYSINIFGVATVSLVATTILTNFLFSHLFTNRSVYSLVALGTIGVIFYNASIVALPYVINAIRSSEYQQNLGLSIFSSLGWDLGLNLASLVLLYFLFSIISPRLKPSILR